MRAALARLPARPRLRRERGRDPAGGAADGGRHGRADRLPAERAVHGQLALHGRPLPAHAAARRSAGCAALWARAMRAAQPPARAATRRARTAPRSRGPANALREHVTLPAFVEPALERTIHPATTQEAAFSAIERTPERDRRASSTSAASRPRRASRSPTARSRRSGASTGIDARLVQVGTAKPEMVAALAALAAELGIADAIDDRGRLETDELSAVLARGRRARPPHRRVGRLPARPDRGRARARPDRGRADRRRARGGGRRRARPPVRARRRGRLRGGARAGSSASPRRRPSGRARARTSGCSACPSRATARSPSASSSRRLRRSPDGGEGSPVDPGLDPLVRVQPGAAAGRDGRPGPDPRAVRLRPLRAHVARDQPAQHLQRLRRRAGARGRARPRPPHARDRADADDRREPAPRGAAGGRSRRSRPTCSTSPSSTSCSWSWRAASC